MTIAIATALSDSAPTDNHNSITNVFSLAILVLLLRLSSAIMCDPWWNKAVESQAMDRVHRLGQKRKVRVYSLVMKDSIEERMIFLQKSKAALGKGSMEKLSPREERRAKLTAMKDLFEIVDEAALNDSDDDFLGASFIDEAEAKESSDDSFIVDSDNEAVEVPLELSDENDSTGFSLGMFSDSSDDDLFSD